MWKDYIPWNAVCRRASGRRGYNAHRKFAAAWRRTRVSDLLVKWGLEYGVQARIAKELRVSEATISRDVSALMVDSNLCPCCRRWRNHDK